MHDTPFRYAPGDAPEMLTMDQFTPSQSSASGTPGPDPLELEPTAMHSVVETQLIPAKVAPAEPVGFGDGTIDHADPFQDSANVVDNDVEFKVLADPTAMQNDTPMHETPPRSS